MNGVPDTLIADARSGRRLGSSAVFFTFLVVATLMATGLIDACLSYRQVTSLLIHIQRQQAESAAVKIGEFVKEIESQLEWLTRVSWDSSVEEWQLNSANLLQRVPAITEFARIDATGREQARISRVALDVIGSYADFSRDPKFAQAMTSKRYRGPVYFRQQSEPYMTVGVAGARREHGVLIAEVNLKFIGDAISKPTVGMPSTTFVVDPEGRLIAHTDMSLVLRNIGLSHLTYVRAAITSSAGQHRDGILATDLNGRSVFTGHVTMPTLPWVLFVELPVSEALATVYSSVLKTLLLLFAAFVIAILACGISARPRFDASGR